LIQALVPDTPLSWKNDNNAMAFLEDLLKKLLAFIVPSEIYFLLA
jgi:hypothetical protein